MDSVGPMRLRHLEAHRAEISVGRLRDLGLDFEPLESDRVGRAPNDSAGTDAGTRKCRPRNHGPLLRVRLRLQGLSGTGRAMGLAAPSSIRMDARSRIRAAAAIGKREGGASMGPRLGRS